MATNQYLPFATAGGANVLAPAAYSALASRLAGFTAGTALSTNLNTVWRQSSVISAMIGQLVGDVGGFDALDDGNVGNLLTSFLRSLQTNKINYIGAGGSANALIATLAPAPASLTAGMRITLSIPSANSATAVTLNVNGLGAKNVYRRNANALGVGDIQPGPNDFEYDGTYWRLMGAPFGQSVISGQGWIDLPGGLTLQWGTGSMTGGTVTLNWPKAFSASPYCCLALDNGAVLWSTTNASFIGISSLNAVGGIFRGITWNGSGMILGSIIFNYFVLGPT